MMPWPLRREVPSDLARATERPRPAEPAINPCRTSICAGGTGSPSQVVEGATRCSRDSGTFVSAIITPIINAFPGANSKGWGFSLRGGPLEQKTFIDISTLINAVIVFVITAAAVYFVLVLPLQKLNERRGVTPKEAAKTDDQRLLEEIRDILREQRT